MAYDYAYTGDSIYSYTVANPDQQIQMANGALSNALGFYTKKNYTRAISEFKRAAALDPSNAQAYNYMANAYQALKKPDDAIKAYKDSLAVDPTQDSVHVSLANVYLGQKKYAQAETEYKTAIKLNPSSTLAPYTLGQMYQQQGKYADAETQFRKVIRMAPNDPNPYYALGATLNKEGKYEEAVKQLQQAIKLRPKMASAHLELGTAYAGLGDTTNAQREVDTLTRIDPAQGYLLKRSIAKPKMLGAGPIDVGVFNYGLDLDWTNATDVRQNISILSGSLINANSSAELSMSFTFDTKMDPDSVQNPLNWSIGRASGGPAGYYNLSLPTDSKDAILPPTPTRVTYDPDKQMATIYFSLNQNADGTALIDPQRVVFKFSGKDVTGKTMDPTADEFDGFAGTSF